MTMQIAATTLDGEPLGLVELVRATDGHAHLNDQLVVAMRPLGSRVALVVGNRQYCVALADYWQVMRAAASRTADEKGE
jgi:hypothetical protein